MTFRAGQPVICIDASMIMHPESTSPLIEGKVYIIRGILAGDAKHPGQHLWLEGVHNRLAGCGIEYAYLASRFRPLVEDRKSVSFTIGADPDSDRWDNRKKIKERT